MNESNEQQTSNQFLPSNCTTQGLVRSSSSSSSSSFDSCSDLLGSLENTEEKPDDLLKQLQTDSKENESRSGAEDVTSHETSSVSKDVLRIPPLKQSDSFTKEKPIFSQLHSELKVETGKMESSTVMDHVYGLSNAVSFSKVKSIAENTVERISLFPSSFRLPTSSIFPLKIVLQTNNTPLPTGSQSQIDVSEVSGSYKDPNLGTVVDNKLSDDRNLANTSRLNELCSVANMPVKDVCGQTSDSAVISTEDSPIQDEPGVIEHVINAVDEEGKSLTAFSGNPASTKSTTDMTASRKDDIEIATFRAGHTALLVDENNVSTEVVFSDLTSADCEGINYAAEADVSSIVSDNKKPQILEQTVTFLQPPRHLQPDVAATSEEIHYSNKQGPQDGSGLQCLESSLMSSDLQKRSVFCHPLRSLSSGSGRPDLEEVDDEQNIFSGTRKFSGWDSTTAETNGSEDLLLPQVDTKPTSVSLLSAKTHTQENNESHMVKGISWDHKANSTGVNQSSALGQQTVPLQNVGPSDVGCWTNQQIEPTWRDQPALIEALEGLNSDSRDSLFLEEQAYGEIPDEERWKGLSIRLEKKLQLDECEQKDNLGPDELCRYVGNLQLNEAYIDTVLDMEDVLLNGDENGHPERFWLASSSSVIGTPRSSRDGSLSSSTSGLNLFSLGESTPFTVDWVEVVGAKQRRGGSSFGERIVGVKDHTVYCIKVFSGNQEWEVLRRYRDFVDLYHQLRRNFNVRTEKPLPSPWREVDRDSRKVFGNTHPNVVEVRSSRIERCLQSLLQAGPHLSTSSPLIWFLCPQSSAKGISDRESYHSTSSAVLQKGHDLQLGSNESPFLQSPRSEVGSLKNELDHNKGSTSLGKTVKLNLKIHPNKNLKQLLSSQHYSCAGCYKHLEADRGLVHGFVQTLGWGKPRLCEYSGQLYCTSCHLNETAVLPAQVLWHWDFTPRRVSQLAKAYLDSIYDQPMLCVSAVNPYLYSRVPILSHVKETRRKLSKMLACMLCPFRMRILQTMASRRYLLENNDFFALRDLEDLSKGAFAVLPSLLKAVLENLRLHITKQCSVCSETGEWCGAGVFCEEPFSPIFPFEEESITCKVCHALFHKACFSRFASCPACSEDGTNNSPLAGAFENPQLEGVTEDCRDTTLPLAGEDVTASSRAGGADLQGGFELDNHSHTQKNWPSFYSLLPKKRLW